MNREKMRIAKKNPIFPIEQIISTTYEEIFIFNVNRKKYSSCHLQHSAKLQLSYLKSTNVTNIYNNVSRLPYL